MDFDTNWQDRYRSMISSPKKALRKVRSGQRLFIGTGCGEPTVLVDALAARASDLADVEILQLFTKGDASYARPEFSDSFRLNSFFIGDNVRSMIQEGFGSYTPVPLSAIPKLFNSGQLPIDIALIQTSPPNSDGKVSLGISVDVVKSAIENVSLVIAQVNEQMVFTQGNSLIDIYDLDILVPVNVPLLEREAKPHHPTSRAIGKNVANLIDNGSTIQLGLGRTNGFGRISMAVIEFLHNKRDLGIHSEMITDDIMELVDAGVITGARKSDDRGKIVASFCLGTKKLYDTLHNNPQFCFRPTEYVNDSHVISRQTRMVAINLAREIDLTGQVAADSQDGMLYSGIGGMTDFNRGALQAKEGKSIIVIPSTNLEGTRSNIVAHLRKGSGVVVTRGDVQYVVTEYGAAYLYGKSIQERIMSLIAVAHPDFREQLFREAVDAHYIRPELAERGYRFVIAADETMHGTRLLEDGTQINLRPVHPTDEPGMRDLLYDLSRETVYYRFMDKTPNFTQKQIQDFVYVDHERDVIIVATVPEAHGEIIIGVGRYYLDPKTNRAEVAFVVRDTWQNRGIGTLLFKHLAVLAEHNRIEGFTASVLRENQRIQTLFNHSGYPVTAELKGPVYNFYIHLQD